MTLFNSSTWDREHARQRKKEGWLDRVGFPSSDRMINLRVTIDMSFRFRFALLLCGFIILVNVLFKVQTDIVETSIYKQSKAAFYHPSAEKSVDQLGEESAADLADRRNGKISRMRNRVMRNRFRQAEEEAGIQKEVEAPAEEHPQINPAIPGHELNQIEEGACMAGHIPGLKDICDSKGCLRRLEAHARDLHSSRREPLSEDDKRRIDFLPGWIDPAHYDLIPLVTDIQWGEGIYGSVGELISGVGKLTSLLSYNVDQSVGEILFVSDDFIGQQNVINNDGKSQYESFVENISHCGYSVTDISSDQSVNLPPKDSKTVYVHKGNVLDLDKELFQRWDIPQFRLLLIEADQDIDHIAVLKSLIISSCILSDGGILVINGVDDSTSQNHILTCLAQYFNGIQGGRPVLVPLLNARNKLYLTTIGHKNLYTGQLARYSTERLGTTLLQITTTKFGSKFTYLTMDD